MRILVAHNAYQQRGGEDSVVESETALLRSRGCEVEGFSRHNDALSGMSRLSAARQTLWSGRTVADAAAAMARFRPDVIHVHNTFPLISPSIYWAADRAGVPVVQTLHNFRLLCPQAMLLREGRVCEDCLGHAPWRGVVHGCYRNSYAGTGVLAGMTVLHRAAGTYRRKVTRYIALNAFCRGKFIQGGLPAERIAVKPNFVDLPAPERDGARDGFLFVGRLAREKGLAVLAEAAAHVQCQQGARIRVVGCGPDEWLIAGMANIDIQGFQDREGVRRAMCAASCLVMPSIWYETFGLVIAEAFACGLPVIASRLGAMAELVRDGDTGLLFEPGDAEDLARKMVWAAAHPVAMRGMGERAREEYEAKYTPGINYRQLMGIYEDAIAARADERGAA